MRHAICAYLDLIQLSQQAQIMISRIHHRNMRGVPGQTDP